MSGYYFPPKLDSNSQNAEIEDQVCLHVNLQSGICFPFQEFLHPLQSSELLSKDQLMSIFLNLEELIDLNSQMTSELSHVLRNAQKLGDNVSFHLFVKCHFFSTYILCVYLNNIIINIHFYIYSTKKTFGDIKRHQRSSKMRKIS